MENTDIMEANDVSQGDTQNTAGMEVINIPLLNVDGSNNISLTRLLSQHGITLQTTPNLQDLTNGQPLTISVMDSTQNNVIATDLIDSSNQVVFCSNGEVEGQMQTSDGLPIVGNQMLCVPNMTQTYTLVTDYMPSDAVANSAVGDSFHSNINLQSRMQFYENFEERKIFAHVVALLSDDISTEVFTNHSAYMNELEKDDVFQISKQEGGCTIAGELWALVLLQKRLQSLLRTGKTQSINYSKPEYCNKWVQTEKPKTSDCAVQTHYPIKKEGVVNCGTMCEILLPSVTAFGREIKQSGRYNTNVSTMLSHTVDEDLDEEYTPRTSRRKRKIPSKMKEEAINPKPKSENNIKGQKVKQNQKIVVIKDNTLSVHDCVKITNFDDNKQVAMVTGANDNIDKVKVSETVSKEAEKEENKIVNTLECFNPPTKMSSILLKNYQPVTTETNSVNSNKTSQNYISNGETNQISELLPKDDSNDLNVSSFIQSAGGNKLSAEEDLLTLTSASDLTPITSEDSLENDICAASDLNSGTSAGVDGSVQGDVPQVEDQIQAALRASQISFEEVPDFPTVKPQTQPKPQMRKKTKKDYEAAKPFNFFCGKCSFKSKRQSHLIKHMKFHETVRKMYYCKQCNFKTIRNGALRRHEMSHSNDILHCNQCKYETDDFISLDRHMKMKHDMATSKKKKKTVYKCPKCDYSSLMPSRFAAHLKVHKDLNGSGSSDIILALQQFEEKDVDPPPFKCSMCTYKSIRKEHLVRHINNVHTDHRPFLCDICGQSFKRKDALSQHKVTHIDKMNRNYAYHCTTCKKPFRSKTHLNEHMAMHSNIRQYLCDICGTSFKTKSCQQKHMRTIHQNPRSFECSSCLKCFNTKFALLRHFRTHEKAANIPGIPNTQTVSPIETVTTQIFHTFDSQPATLVQDIITTDGEVFETTEDNLQQVLLKTNDSSESATAIMYLPTSLQPSCF